MFVCHLRCSYYVIFGCKHGILQSTFNLSTTKVTLKVTYSLVKYICSYYGDLNRKCRRMVLFLCQVYIVVRIHSCSERGGLNVSTTMITNILLLVHTQVSRLEEFL